MLNTEKLHTKKDKSQAYIFKIFSNPKLCQKLIQAGIKVQATSETE